MLVVSRKDGQEVRIGDGVTVRVLKSSDGTVKVGIEAPPEIPILRGELSKPRSVHEVTGLPRFWHLFSLALPKRTREENFDPSFGDFHTQYVEARIRYPKGLSAFCVKVAFTVRTLQMIAGCVKASSLAHLTRMAMLVIGKK